MPARATCRSCRHSIWDALSKSRGYGPCCWQGLDPAKRAEIEASLPKPPRRWRLTVRHVLPRRRDRDPPEQPSLFDEDPQQDPAA